MWPGRRERLTWTLPHLPCPARCSAAHPLRHPRPHPGSWPELVDFPPSLPHLDNEPLCINERLAASLAPAKKKKKRLPESKSCISIPIPVFFHCFLTQIFLLFLRAPPSSARTSIKSHPSLSPIWLRLRAGRNHLSASWPCQTKSRKKLSATAPRPI